MKFLLILGAILFQSLALSEVVYINYADTEKMTIIIKNRIIEKDVSDFRLALADLKKKKKKLHMNAIQLQSTGGRVKAAIDIGSLIRYNGLNTYLAPESECQSACVLLLASGIIRMAYGKVEVHRATINKNNMDKEVPRDNFSNVDSLVSSYLKRMGASMLLADAILTTPFWKYREITEIEKIQWSLHGIERNSEEKFFRLYAKENAMTKDKFVSKFVKHYERCTEASKRFELTVFECALNEQ